MLRPPTRALPSVIVDTEKVLREAEGPTKARGPEASNAWWVERCSHPSAPQNRTVRAGRSPKNTSSILEADESTRIRMGNSIPQNHEDHIAGKGENSLQHYNLVHKFIPMPQAMKIPAAKAAVDKEWEKLEKISAWNLTKVKSKKQVIDEARTSGATVHFASLMDICHLKKC